ncbi:AAA family ATPase [Pseudomonas sp. RP23018S]|uniref:AAA family ATPase n=1 Tax=Pseudomonas sp. RP23018S TaxID=3096037 RepID=UPI002ACACB00|nr:AAA family ATPase [Pseudomonas sp. RP23018S]MDZ5601983.1 AAA family ATPase [Pseudomonas sp. RP23018S]
MHEAYRFVACLNADRVRSRDEISAMLEQISPRLAIRYMDIWAKPAGVCSYGEIRSFLALSLLTSGSDLFILDEPTAGVDPEFQYYLWQAVRHACALGATVVFSSHQITEVAEHCDGFYLLHNRTFQRFEQANDFMAVHQANSLSEAFMNALNAVEH